MKYILLFVLLFFINNISFTQYEYLSPKSSQIAGGIGLTWIDGVPYYLFNFSPDLSFGKFGVGLDLNIRVNKEGNIRTEEFNTFSDYLAVIKYVRYGLKGDPFYTKIGGLSRAFLGQGNIVHFYNNRSSYDNRKVGIELDIDFGTFGFESIYGDLSGAGLLGLRGHTKPLQLFNVLNIPVISNITAGVTYVTDLNEFSGVTKAKIEQDNKVTKLTDEGKLTIIGLDLSFPVLKSKYLGIDIYTNYAKILKFGSGSSAGVKFNFSGLGIFSADLIFERWFNGDNFIPHYFDMFYEIQRYSIDTTNKVFNGKAMALSSLKSPGNSWNGQLLIDLLNFVQIYGYYSRFDNLANSGKLRLETDLSPKEGSFVVRGYYDRINIINEEDIFKLDDRSILTAEVGYKPMSYILLSILYQWTFTPERDASDNIIGYAPQKRIEPRVSLIFPFDLMGDPQKKK